MKTRGEITKSANVLLVNPPWRKITYLQTNIKVATLSHPLLCLPIIAAPLIAAGHNVRILDLDIQDHPDEHLRTIVREFCPEWLGITGTTPFAQAVIRISEAAKEIAPRLKVIVGGVHATVLPNDLLDSNTIDLVALGEADFTLRDLLAADDWRDVPGILFKDATGFVATAPRPPVNNLDELPFPAWPLVEHKERYRNSYLLSRKNPVGPMETSRGCPWDCSFCNKSVFGHRFRAKSVGRVVDEMAYLLQSGFNEIHIQDDNFTTDLQRAKQICDEIIRRRLKFPWMLMNGIRVNGVDLELFTKLKAAGCYLVGFGIESGSQTVLDEVQKGITLDMIRTAVALARKAGVDTYGFFMLGLPGDTVDTLRQTIAFAKELDLDFAKFDITIPYPGTRLFKDWDAQGLIRSKNWTDYIHHQDETILYQHPNLDWPTLRHFYRQAFRDYYLRPAYIFKRLKRSLRRGEILKDAASLFQTRW